MHQEELFHEIYDFYEIPYWQTTWFKVVIALSAIIFIALVVYLIIRRKKRVIPAWDIALLQLNKITIDTCVTKHDFKKLYFEMSKILKQYLQERYNLKVIDKTDDELIAYLQKNNIDESLLEMLKKLFMGTSLIKYADEVALKTQVEQDLMLAKTLVETTIPTE